MTSLLICEVGRLRAMAVIAAVLISACGGASDPDPASVATVSIPETSKSAENDAKEDANARKAARLNQAELQQAALQNVGLNEAQRKALAAGAVPVYRFFNTLTSACRSSTR